MSSTAALWWLLPDKCCRHGYNTQLQCYHTAAVRGIMVNVYVITSTYVFEEAEKLKEAMVGADAWTRPGVNASHESELMVGADAWTKPAINAFHNAMLIPIMWCWTISVCLTKTEKKGSQGKT